MPVVTKDDQDEAVKRRKERRERRETGGEEEAPYPVPMSRMLNLPESVVIGSSLTLVLTCPSLRKSLELQEQIYEAWPDVLVYAVVGDMAGKGINPAAVLHMEDRARRGLYEEAKRLTLEKAEATGQPRPELPEYKPPTVDDIRESMYWLMDEVKEALPKMADTLWAVAGTTPGLAWPVTEKDGKRDVLPEGFRWLDDALMDCTIPELADVLRAALGCLGGFRHGVAERFTAP